MDGRLAGSLHYKGNTSSLALALLKRKIMESPGVVQ